MLIRIVLAIALWIVSAIGMRIGVIEPAIGASALLVAVLLVVGPWLLRVAAFWLDVCTGI
jgi:hypothetical protein